MANPWSIACPCGVEIVLNEEIRVFHCAFFSEEVAWAADKSGWYHIDKEGEPLYRQRYDWTESFHEGLAEARKGDKAFHIRKDGAPAYEERFDEVSFFFKGQAKVRLGKERFRIRHDGSRAD